MFEFARQLALAAAVAALGACARVAPPADAAADAAAIRAVNAAWKAAYNAGDVAAVAALYADDAVLSAPGAPALLGSAAINEYFTGTVAEFAAAGLTVVDQPLGDVVASGNLAWQWQSYRIVDRSGAVVDAGTLVTLFRRRDGRWLIAGDTWNSDGSAGKHPELED